MKLCLDCNSAFLSLESSAAMRLPDDHFLLVIAGMDLPIGGSLPVIAQKREPTA